MKHTEKQAINIAENYKKKYPNLTNKIIKAQFNEKFDVQGGGAWIVIGNFELFGEVREFYYVISDISGEVEYTFNEHGTRNPHIETKEDKKLAEEWDNEWEEFNEKT